MLFAAFARKNISRVCIAYCTDHRGLLITNTTPTALASDLALRVYLSSFAYAFFDLSRPGSEHEEGSGTLTIDVAQGSVVLDHRAGVLDYGEPDPESVLQK